MSQLDDLRLRLRTFAAERDWGQFHSPKNLAMALASEAGELLAEFRWLTEQQSELAQLEPSKLDAISMEIADVAIFLVRLADVLDIDVLAAAARKVELNESRFPAA